ncbi:hypothetical protein PoB_000265200 [Plakobranchus ocellatus]|uniref:Uncharacterized protein n=1 Tax=Plakobranchus ocellatus TaxID=259542 RepID=A0AAV3Y1Y3_9GAST|nr:hypothetical protein PoB_000265200 [Plakobranchus ocellatus]
MLLEYKRRSRSFSFHTPPVHVSSQGHPSVLLVPPSAPRMVRLVGGSSNHLHPLSASASSLAHGVPQPAVWRPVPMLMRFRSQPDIAGRIPSRPDSTVKGMSNVERALIAFYSTTAGDSFNKFMWVIRILQLQSTALLKTCHSVALIDLSQ